MAKMYYSEQETLEKLGVTHAELMDMVRQGKLRAYADGTKKVFKVPDVDGLSGGGDSGASSASSIQLAPVDLSSTGSAIDLTDTESSRTGSGVAKSYTVVTSEGISIFDDEELELESADPMAKTRIAPSLDEQIGLEGVNAGSGLLDLTRESDDTSLGAEVLDHIDMESGEAAAPSVESVAESISPEDIEEAPAVAVAPVAVEAFDPAAGAFAAMAGVGAIIALLLAALGMSVLTGKSPSYVGTLGENLIIVTVAAIGLAVVAAVVALMVGKGMTNRPPASGGS
jgi:hypothetical protein